jgi:hypothetical protein
LKVREDGFLLLEDFVRGANDPSPRLNVRKVFIRFKLGLDFGFWVIGKVLILLGFAAGDVDKVFISNRKSPRGKFPQGLLVRFLYCFKYRGFGVTKLQ